MERWREREYCGEVEVGGGGYCGEMGSWRGVVSIGGAIHTHSLSHAAGAQKIKEQLWRDQV